MCTASLFVGVDVQHGSTQVLALDSVGQVALRAHLPRAHEAEVAPRVVELLATVSRAHDRARVVLCVDGDRWAVDQVLDTVGEQLSSPLHFVRRDHSRPPPELLTQDCWTGPFREAWRLAMLAALGYQPELDEEDR